MTKQGQKARWVAVSGGFDPVHVGHIRLFRRARNLGDKLLVILNNDNWLRGKKGYVFMPEKERKELLLALSCVDRVVMTSHHENDPDRSVVRELKKLRPALFVNGGDRKKDNTPEREICRKLSIETVFGVGGGKVQSSSWLVKKVKERSKV
ncbi:adenylyltransferase/cytidyltransferase family protein [Nordella sp. HKS 07]|uniref:adenylyltransferase/cytidyltransferase family protein n=1 Tax=Nordella sp. HKS 07 TaxID=2712222 RepID=UPI0013E16174|nr:adenylyltransferase/cytidyltransferase family protein [Nordella sp. HKS 07]QIG51854.1 adenylyltransferase/cytidyltransferase family protein [Nordella sp. HKS 07]